MSEFTIPGPSGDDTFGEAHRGKFRRPSTGEYRGWASCTATLATSRECQYRVCIEEYVFESATQTMRSLGRSPATNWQTLSGHPTFQTSRTFRVHQELAPQTTHWAPVVEFRTLDEDPIPSGHVIRFDEIWVNENGYPTDEQPYLDGDQIGARWEGEWSASTSIWVDRTYSQRRSTADADLSVRRDSYVMVDPGGGGGDEPDPTIPTPDETDGVPE